MAHDPFGTLGANSSRIGDGVYAKGYPERIRCDTADFSGFPEYERPDVGRSVMQTGILLTNQWVVPHNQWICDKYDALINVEGRRTAAAVKYPNKYANNGPGRKIVDVANDDVKTYLGGRYFPEQEAPCGIRFRTVWKKPISPSAPRSHRGRARSLYPRLWPSC